MGYDALGRVTSSSLDLAGLGQTVALAYAYDAATALYNPAGMSRLKQPNWLIGLQPIITDIDFESLPIALVNLSGPPGFDERTLKQIAEDVEEELRTIDGVSNTQLFGGREREIHVNVNPDLFVEYGFSLPEIFRAVTDFHSKLPGGSLNTSEYDYQIRNEGDAGSQLAMLQRLVLPVFDWLDAGRSWSVLRRSGGRAK